VGPAVEPMTPSKTAYEQVCPADAYLDAANGDCIARTTLCPANSVSPPGSDDIDDCKCLGGYFRDPS
jgi:hypothetical protein